jgi:hypothetical protein
MPCIQPVLGATCVSKSHNWSRRAPLESRLPVGGAVSALILLAADVADALCVGRALAAVVGRRGGADAGSIRAGGQVHTGSNHGDPALEVLQNGPAQALLCVRRGCSPGQRCSQRPYMGATSAPRARGTLTVPTAYYRSQMVAVHGRPGHIWSRIGVGGSAFLTSGPGGPVVPPRGPTPHVHRYNRITLILILCIGFACVRADSGKLPPREGEKTSKRNG